jgi:hypothetical protein
MFRMCNILLSNYLVCKDQVLGHPYARPIMPFLPPQVQQFADNATLRETMEDYDSASLYIAQW